MILHDNMKIIYTILCFLIAISLIGNGVLGVMVYNQPEQQFGGVELRDFDKELADKDLVIAEKETENQSLKMDILNKKKTEINLEDYGIPLQDLVELKINGEVYSLDECLKIK